MFGLFRTKKERSEQSFPPLSAEAAPGHRDKAFCIALGWKGLLGLVLIFCILQLWMFFLGMWAAQSIVFPTAQTALPAPAAVRAGEEPGRGPKQPPASAGDENAPAQR